MYVTGGMLVWPTAGVASCGNSRGRVAVITAIEREDLVLAGVYTSHANCIFDCIGSTVGKENLIEMRASAIGDQLGSLGASIVAMFWRDRCQLRCLILNRFNNLRMLKTNIGEDQLARKIEVLVAVVIPEVTPQAASDGHRADLALGRPRVKYVSAIKVENFFAAGWVCNGLCHKRYLII